VTMKRRVTALMIRWTHQNPLINHKILKGGNDVFV
jgi:hypothetical protein